MVEVAFLEASFVAAVSASAALHGDWYSAPATARGFRDLLARCDGIDQIVYLLLLGPSGAPCGTASISNIVRGSFRSGYLSFAAFEPYDRRGLMTAGLGAVISDAFGDRGLHRLEANVQPGNARSIALVRRLGFRLEGHSPRYLNIAGAWRGHDRFALTAEEWPVEPEPRGVGFDEVSTGPVRGRTPEPDRRTASPTRSEPPT